MILPLILIVTIGSGFIESTLTLLEWAITHVAELIAYFEEPNPI